MAVLWLVRPSTTLARWLPEWVLQVAGCMHCMYTRLLLGRYSREIETKSFEVAMCP